MKVYNTAARAAAYAADVAARAAQAAAYAAAYATDAAAQAAAHAAAHAAAYAAAHAAAHAADVAAHAARQVAAGLIDDAADFNSINTIYDLTIDIFEGVLSIGKKADLDLPRWEVANVSFSRVRESVS
jgi:hypothetical protein